MGDPAQQGLDLAGTLIRIKQIKWAFASQCGRWAAEPFAGLLAAAEGIFGSRPWKVYGEGPSTVEKSEAGQFGGARDVRSKPYTIEDIRFTAKGDALYAYLLAPQPATQAIIKSLATISPHISGRKVKAVTILGGGKLEWSQGEQGLRVKLPERLPSSEAIGLRISGVL